MEQAKDSNRLKVVLVEKKRTGKLIKYVNLLPPEWVENI